MDVSHIHITKALLLVVINQVAALVIGFGIVNSFKVGVVVNATTAIINAVFLNSNAKHAIASAVAQNPQATNVVST